jgi:hypothetical protein
MSNKTTFQFVATTLPAFSAKVGNDIIGFISFLEIEDAILIVALGVLQNTKTLE